MHGEKAGNVISQMHLTPSNTEHGVTGQGTGVSSPACEVLAALSWFTAWSQTRALCIKAQSPPFFFCLRRANFHHKDTRTVNIDLLDGWCTSRHRPLKHLLVTTQPSPLWGNNAKWPPVLATADSKYLKEINFSEWKHLSLFSNPLSSQVMLILGLCVLPAPGLSIVCLPRSLWFSCLVLGAIISTVANEGMFAFSLGNL